MNVRLPAITVAALIIFAGCQAFSGTASTSTPTKTEIDNVTTPSHKGTATSQAGTRPVYTERERLTWSLSLFLAEVTPKSGGELTGYVATEGTHGGHVSGVAIQFVSENGTVISEVPVGNITELGKQHRINATIPTVPVYVVPKADDWETPESEFDHISGAYITAEGEIRPYRLIDPANFTR